jgi:hypothetical protein
VEDERRVSRDGSIAGLRYYGLDEAFLRIFEDLLEAAASFRA